MTQLDVPLAWLALDEDDNDVSGFMAALIGALQVIEPAFGLSTTEIDQLQSRTEGWAAGLSLFANSLERLSPEDRSELIAHLSQSHRHIFDYLSEEVLHQQPPDIQEFLLQSSILQELTPDLCAVVTGRTDTAVLLETLYQQNVFVLAVQKGGDGAVYRYHALFAKFLRYVLVRDYPDQISELHQRAATAVPTLQRKIHHLSEAGLWHEVAEVIIKVGKDMIRQGRLDTLVGWIRVVPEETASQHPHLTYFRGLVAIQKGELEAAADYLNAARQTFTENGDKAGLGATLASLGSVAFLQLRPDESLEMVAQALAFPLEPAMWVQALMTRASINLFIASDWLRAAADLDKALALVTSSRDDAALLVLTFYLGQEFLALPNVLAQVEAFYQEIEADLGDVALPVRLAVADVLAFVYLRRGQLAEAIEAGQSAVAIKEHLNGYPFLGMNAAVTVASAYAVNGRYQEADQYLRQAKTQYDAFKWNQITGIGGLFTLARIRWLEGRIDVVRRVYEQMHIVTKLPTMPAATVFRLLVKGLLAMSAQNYEMAERSFQEAVTIDAEAYLSSIYSCPQLLLAHLYWRRQRSTLAWKTFAPILHRCEAENTPGIILQEGALAVPLLKLANTHQTDVVYAEKLLGVLETAVSLQSPAIRETPLTDREMEVLCLLAQGASNKMIADDLVVSLPTVKSHVSHILSKLQASSRGEAVAVARNRQLI